MSGAWENEAKTAEGAAVAGRIGRPAPASAAFWENEASLRRRADLGKRTHPRTRCPTVWGNEPTAEPGSSLVRYLVLSHTDRRLRPSACRTAPWRRRVQGPGVGRQSLDGAKPVAGTRQFRQCWRGLAGRWSRGPCAEGGPVRAWPPLRWRRGGGPRVAGAEGTEA